MDVTNEKIERFISKHLAWTKDVKSTADNIPTVDWEAFQRDLQECPEVAFREIGSWRFPPLQWALIVPDVPLKVVQKLIEMNEKAVNLKGDDWNTLQFILWVGERSDISPDILRAILEKAPELVIEVLKDFLFVCKREGKLTDQVIAVLESSPHAVALLLLGHFVNHDNDDDERPWPVGPDVLECALANAEKFEKEGAGIFDLPIVTWSSPSEMMEEEQDQFCLVERLFDNLDSKNRELFHRYLKAFVKGRLAYMARIYPNRHISIDVTSLTCCVLFLLATLESTKVENAMGYYDSDDSEHCQLNFYREQLWKRYMKVCQDDVTKASEKGILPLSCAIRLGFQWSPVIDGIWEKDKSVLEKIDADLALPSFLVAASVTEKQRNCHDWEGSYGTWYRRHNTVNTTYALLRANPSQIGFRATSDANETTCGDRKRAAAALDDAEPKSRGGKRGKESAT